jgi:hypothetical protein
MDRNTWGLYNWKRWRASAQVPLMDARKDDSIDTEHQTTRNTVAHPGDYMQWSQERTRENKDKGPARRLDDKGKETNEPSSPTRAHSCSM